MKKKLLAGLVVVAVCGLANAFTIGDPNNLGEKAFREGLQPIADVFSGICKEPNPDVVAASRLKSAPTLALNDASGQPVKVWTYTRVDKAPGYLLASGIYLKVGAGKCVIGAVVTDDYAELEAGKLPARWN